MPTLNSTGNIRRGLPSLISSGKVWKTSLGNGTSTVKWSLNSERENKKQGKGTEGIISNSFSFTNTAEFVKLVLFDTKDRLEQAVKRRGW